MYRPYFVRAKISADYATHVSYNFFLKIERKKERKKERKVRKEEIKKERKKERKIERKVRKKERKKGTEEKKIGKMKNVYK